MKPHLTVVRTLLRSITGLKERIKTPLTRPLAEMKKVCLRCARCGTDFEAISHFVRFCKDCNSKAQAQRYAGWYRAS